MENQDRRQKMLDDYADIRAALGGAGASSAVAKAMIAELNNKADTHGILLPGKDNLDIVG